jgi:hypothetical protein
MHHSLIVGVCIGGIALATFPVRAQECFPACREAYICIEGQCVSACNPPCDPGEKCTAEGACVATEPPPAQAAPPQAPPAQAAPPPEAHYGAPPPAPHHTVTGLPEGQPAPASEAPGFSFLLRFGPTVSWYVGGHVELGFAFGLADGVYLVPSLRGAGGMGISDDNGFASGSADVSVRFLRWGAIGGVGQIGLGVSYMKEFGSYEYEYVAPHLRAGGGILFGSSGRFGWGVEVTTRLGYAINTYSDWDDYSGFYGGLDFSLVLTL